jgi:hypothetical protein
MVSGWHQRAMGPGSRLGHEGATGAVGMVRHVAHRHPVSRES